MINTVADLIKALEQFPKDAKIAGTWEGTVVTIEEPYVAKCGTVLLDVDNNFYKQRYIDGSKKI